VAAGWHLHWPVRERIGNRFWVGASRPEDSDTLGGPALRAREAGGFGGHQSSGLAGRADPGVTLGEIQ